MAHSDLGLTSPTGTTSDFLSNPDLAESPASTPLSTHVVYSSHSSERLESDDAVPPLRLDDIQSAIPLHDELDSNEGKYLCLYSSRNWNR